MSYLICLISLFVASISFLKIESEKKRQLIFWTIAFLLIFIAGFRVPGKDYNTYLSMYEMAGNNNMLTEPTFLILSLIVKWLFNDVIALFLIYSIIGVTLKFIAIQELTKLWFFSILFYLSNIYILHELIQIRAGVASALLLLCIKPAYERDFLKFIIIFVIAFLFHYSALVILPIWFLKKDEIDKRVFIFLIPAAYLLYFLNVNIITSIPIPSIKAKIELYKVYSERGGEEWSNINLFNMLFLIKIAVYYFILIKIDFIASKNSYAILLLKVYGLSLASLVLLSSIPIIAFRISELFSVVEIILFPLIYYTMKPHFISRIIVTIFSFFILSILLWYNQLLIN